MTKNTTCCLTLLVLMMGAAFFTYPSSAQGLQRITIRFTLSSDDPLAPHIPIAGTIVYTAPSSLDPIQSFESVNLTIAGHNYSVGEIGYVAYGNDSFDIGGLVHGVGAISNDFTDDFDLRWNPITGMPIDFSYGTSRYGGIWPRFTGPGMSWKESFPSFTVTAESVPEPSPAPLLLLAVVFAGLTRVRTSRSAGA